MSKALISKYHSKLWMLFVTMLFSCPGLIIYIYLTIFCSFDWKNSIETTLILYFLFFALSYLITGDLMKNFTVSIACPAKNWENKQDIKHNG